MSPLEGSKPNPWPGLAASVRGAMPDVLRVDLVAGVELWQAIGLVALVAAAWLVAVLAMALAASLGRRLTRRTTTTLDDALLERLRGPGRLLFLALVVRPALGLLGLPKHAFTLVQSGARATFVVALFWSLLRGVTIASAHVAASEWTQARPGSRSLVMLGGSLARVAVLVLGVVTVLSELNYPVASLLAGLGLGGLALALAAQKTVEHLFGAFALAVDQPFRVGDMVKVEDFVGTVERIGMRSTRFRTLDRTLITIPNGKLADARLETFAARDRIRLACTLGLDMRTSPAQLHTVIATCEQALRAHPLIWPDAVVVRFREIAASSLDIEVMAWFKTADWAEFQLVRQEMLLQFLELVQAAGTSLAFPTQTLFLSRAAPPTRDEPAAPATAPKA